MNIDREEIIRLTEEYGGPWGINHTRRLLHLISIIGKDQTYDSDIVWLSAHLHDWGGYSPWVQADVDHALRSKWVAETFLAERRYPADVKAHVLECIEFHHRGEHPGQSIESILLCDADALDFLGVVGVLRDFAKNPKDLRKSFESAKKRREQLPGLISLVKSKEIAAGRVAEMDKALASFEQETFGCF